jgi:hypothetical protein
MWSPSRRAAWRIATQFVLSQRSLTQHEFVTDGVYVSVTPTGEPIDGGAHWAGGSKHMSDEAAITGFKRQHGDARLDEVLIFATKVLKHRPDTDWAELAEVVTTLFPRVLLPQSRREREFFFTALRHGVAANLLITCDPNRRAREAWSMKCLAGGLLDADSFGIGVVAKPASAA